jgi:DNA-binding IclR family transcriptional regulator
VSSNPHPTLSEVSRVADLPLTTVSRLLKSLEQAGYLYRDRSGIYNPGAKALQIGLLALHSLSLYDLSIPHLENIADYTGETAYLAVPDGENNAMYLRQIESSRAIRHASWSGHSIPTEGTALGAALTGRTQEAYGFAHSRGTAIEPDAAAVAAPVKDGNGDIIAALSMIGPAFRISDEDLLDYGKAVHHEAENLSKKLQLM